MQLAAYAHAVSTVVGEPVVRAALLFLAPDRPVAREVDVSMVDIQALPAQVR